MTRSDATYVLEEATGVLMAALDCDAAHALALMRARAHSAHVDLLQVAGGVVDAQTPERQWRWSFPLRTVHPLTERCA
jgi:AmiR/NasT family two-component response regulator